MISEWAAEGTVSGIFIRGPGLSLGSSRVDGIGYIGEHQPAGPLHWALRGESGLQRDRGIRDLDQGHALFGPVPSTLWCPRALGTSYVFCLECPPTSSAKKYDLAQMTPPPSHPQLALPPQPVAALNPGPRAWINYACTDLSQQTVFTSVPPSPKAAAQGLAERRCTGNNRQIVSSPKSWVDQGSQPNFLNIPRGNES